jgi:hypothetical protein
MRLQKPDRSPRKRSETRDLVQPIIRALNRMQGVRVVRNANLGPVVPYHKRWDADVRPILAGLGAGSADVVGIVTVGARAFGRVFCLEVKLPADERLRAGTLSADQKRWLSVVRRFGGFACVVRSIDEATQAVQRCRKGASE